MFTRISQRDMVVWTLTNIIRLVPNFLSHWKTTFYHLLTTFLVCQISLVVNVVEGCKLIEDVYLIEEKNCSMMFIQHYQIPHKQTAQKDH